MNAVIQNETAKKAFLSCVTAILNRPIPEQMLFMGDMSQSAADFLSGGFFGEILGDRKETTLRKLHAVLSEIRKAE